MPVSIARLRELIDLAASEGVEGIDMIEAGTRIRITRGATPVARAQKAAAAGPLSRPVDQLDSRVFSAPMFGLLHLTPAPGASPYVAVGDIITQGQQLCLIEAMKMFNSVLSDRAGRLEAILAEPGSEVARGQPLFRINGG
ncbi:AccB Biotin carboxyl carrier protein [Rhabdaerophilaceae bacterium]